MQVNWRLLKTVCDADLLDLFVNCTDVLFACC